MLEASGTGLEEIRVSDVIGLSAEGGAALARVLRACSATLKDVSLHGKWCYWLKLAFASEVAPGLASCCETLERLHVLWEIFRWLPPTFPAFTRLTHLILRADIESIDLTSRVWDVTASGRMPALTDLELQYSDGLSWGNEGECRLPCALEVWRARSGDWVLRAAFSRGPSDAVCHELGVAIGKMRRLKYLSLRLFHDGRFYHLMGRGLAASGGCPPLLELELVDVSQNLDHLAFEPSLIVPSVRSLVLWGSASEKEALVLGCGLVQLGYKHRLMANFTDAAAPIHRAFGISPAGACFTAVLQSGGISAYCSMKVGLCFVA
jgi:hypothetical protein